MSTALEGFGDLLESVGWVRYSGGNYHIPGFEHVSWTHRTLPLRLWSTADRTGMREHVLARPLPQGAGWAWRVEMADNANSYRSALFVVGAAQGASEDGHAADPGAVFSWLTSCGWTVTCGTDPEEASYGVTGPDGQALVHLPESPVDPGMWVLSSPSGGQMTASSGTPWSVVVALTEL